MSSTKDEASPRIKVLLLDRSRFSRLRLAAVFSGVPDVVFCHGATVAECAQLAEELFPTVLLLSLDEEVATVVDTLARLRQSPALADVPVIGLAELEDQQGVAIAGVERCLSKYASPEALVEHVRACSAALTRARRRGLEQQAAADRTASSARVLLVDDSLVICKGIAQQLSGEANVELVYTVRPAVALELAKRFRPTVILLDLEMPEVSGFELLAALRADQELQAVPVIVLSGIADPAVKAEAFRRGAHDYAEKRMDTVELTSRLRYHSTAYLNALQLDRSINELIEAKARLQIQRDFIRATFGRYLSDEVVATILETPEGLELGGEKRVISILMADLRGFTALSERLPPESVLSIINNYLRVMTEIIQRHDGTIDEFIGDAILAIFGAPLQRPDDALRAIACALEMQLAIAEVNASNVAQGFPAVAMGIGINTGEVVVGNLGSERRAKYGVVGRHVNLAARIESYTVGGQILVSSSSIAAAAPAQLRVDRELEVMPKGLDAPITIFDIGGVGSPYDLQLPEAHDVELLELAAPLPVLVDVVKDKQAAGKPLAARMTRLAGDTAELVGDLALERLANVRLALGDGAGGTVTTALYGKVVDVTADRIRIRFTAIPPEAEDFLGRVEALAAGRV